MSWLSQDLDQQTCLTCQHFRIADRDGKEQGLHFTFDIEDSSDNDFNDYSVNVACWHRRG